MTAIMTSIPIYFITIDSISNGVNSFERYYSLKQTPESLATDWSTGSLTTTNNTNCQHVAKALFF